MLGLIYATPLGLLMFFDVTQGSSDPIGATLGFVTESLWDSFAGTS